MDKSTYNLLIIQYNTRCQAIQSNLTQPIMQVHFVLRVYKCWWLWYLGFESDVFFRKPHQLSLKMVDLYVQSYNSVIYSGQDTIIIIDCSIEHLINIVLEKKKGSLMHILQYLYLSFIPRYMLSTYTILHKCIPILSTKIRKGNSSGKVVESRHIYLSN